MFAVTSATTDFGESKFDNADRYFVSTCIFPIRNDNKNFKSSEHINKKVDGPYRGFDYQSLVSDPLGLATWSQIELLKFYNFLQ